MAVLGLLNEAPMHGYEIRKRLNALFGWSRALSYGSLYPCLKAMLRKGWISEDTTASGSRRRAKIVYRITEQGQARFAEHLAEGGPAAWDDDERFGVHFAFFARTDAAVRLRILEGRLRRLEERLERGRAQIERTQERRDAYALELQRYGMESVEREMSWLSRLIASERRRGPATTTTSTTSTTTTSTTTPGPPRHDLAAPDNGVAT